MKIRPVVAELFHTDSRTDGRTAGRTDSRTDGRTAGRTERRIDMTKLIVYFRNFANAPRKEPLFIPDKYSNFPE